ncbi:MAG TPA: DUF4389 domain-containing protein [Solirubrobacterales bacterium]
MGLGAADPPPATEPAVAGGRPVRLVVTNDLERGRLSVFFRALLALPFLIWLGIWAVAAFLVAIFNWAIVLVLGRPNEGIHGFLARFVRYATHVYAFLNLAAEPFPGVGGKPGYRVDVEIDPPTRQNRWSVAFRLVLAVPALLLAATIVGRSASAYDLINLGRSSAGNGLSLLVAAAALGWFAAIALGRMPRGLRDLVAYALSYGAQLWAYLLVLTDRYPSGDPLTSFEPLPTRTDPVRMENGDEGHRSRLTVFFRLPLAVPHLVWLSLWGILALFAAIASWFATLARGTSPQSLHRFLSAYVRYQLHVGAFLYLVGNPFPGFTGAENTYPVELRVAGRARQNRWAVFFRLVLALPALLLAAAFGSLLLVVAVLGWFAALFTGRMPLGLRNAGALGLRYTAQLYGYLLLVTESYPYSGPCFEAPPPPIPETVSSPALG